jgi:NAD(P)H-quinone oxidoreductase subunit 4
VIIFLAAVGVILTPIYLLNLLKQVFYGNGKALVCDVNSPNLNPLNAGEEEAACFGTDCVLPTQAIYRDASPREVFIAACFIVVIVGIGLYPKAAMQMYDVKTVAVNTQVRQSYTQIAQANPGVYANGFLTPKLVETDVVLGTLK